ncbi:hypothetical protein HSBAA_01380 [Vreelandella sulfidaeris]|uniref:Uncharacterized protein n=1 Tax=Vreelandella sulfidaeris TaxID=115553 RepID=A0A455TZE0_9GAMM|nr:hypothetical protein HSBAA_01380 [Halomonas sulfidaeris]
MNELTGQMLSVRMKHNQAMLDYIRQIAEKRSISQMVVTVPSRVESTLPLDLFPRQASCMTLQ